MKKSKIIYKINLACIFLVGFSRAPDQEYFHRDC